MLQPARQRPYLDDPLHHPRDCSAAADERAREPLKVAALTRRMVEGDEMAYRVFYNAYFDRLMRYLLVVTGGDEDVAREALQAALVRVVRHIKVFPDETALWRWLTVLARSAFTDETRKRRRYPPFGHPLPIDTCLARCGSGCRACDNPAAYSGGMARVDRTIWREVVAPAERGATRRSATSSTTLNRYPH